MKKRVLVIGAQDFVGARVVAALGAGDWAEPVPCSGPGVTPAQLEGVDAIFNGTQGAPAVVRGTARTLYTALAHRNAGVRAVHLSSMTVYGSATGLTVEDSVLRRDLGDYGASQIDAEASAGVYAHRVILRPGCEYGPGCPHWSERIARLLWAHRLGDLGDLGDGICNLVFIDDLVDAVIAALRIPGLDGRCFNLAMPMPPTWNDYLTQFARALGAVPVRRISARRLTLETRALGLPLKMLEMIERRLSRGRSHRAAPAITPSLLHLCAQAITLDSSRAGRELGIVWTPLSDGLRRTAACYRSGSSGSMSIRRNSIG